MAVDEEAAKLRQQGQEVHKLAAAREILIKYGNAEKCRSGRSSDIGVVQNILRRNRRFWLDSIVPFTVEFLTDEIIAMSRIGVPGTFQLSRISCAGFADGDAGGLRLSAN